VSDPGDVGRRFSSGQAEHTRMMRIAQAPMRKLTNPWSQWHMQMQDANRLLHDVTAYARQIGCTVTHDEIMCHTEEQSRKLAARWKENFNG
jgi:hypothetical protein